MCTLNPIEFHYGNFGIDACEFWDYSESMLDEEKVSEFVTNWSSSAPVSKVTEGKGKHQSWPPHLSARLATKFDNQTLFLP